MKTKEIERLIANKIADHWYKEIHGQVAPIFGKQKLRDFAEAELKKLHIPHVVGRSEQLSCGRNITTCVFYKDGSKCSSLEYCKDQTT